MISTATCASSKHRTSFTASRSDHHSPRTTPWWVIIACCWEASTLGVWKTAIRWSNDGTKGTSREFNRHVSIHYAQDKLYNVNIRPAQPENDPTVGHPRMLEGPDGWACERPLSGGPMTTLRTPRVSAAVMCSSIKPRTSFTASRSDHHSWRTTTRLKRAQPRCRCCARQLSMVFPASRVIL